MNQLLRWSESQNPRNIKFPRHKIPDFSSSKVNITNVILNENLGFFDAMNFFGDSVYSPLLRFMGYREEYLRPDAASYLRDVRNPPPQKTTPNFSPEQLNWPLDPGNFKLIVRV
jgi:hypothetical protein